MHGDDALATTRAEARSFEKALPTARRKAHGQFFTGLKVGRLLAHLAVGPDTQTVMDPMAGTGDLLDAVWETVSSRKDVQTKQLDAIEIDAGSSDLCSRRLRLLVAGTATRCESVQADAFDPRAHPEHAESTYDLVIANPPYVRYQSMGGRGETYRRGLLQIIAQTLAGPSRDVFATLASGYSGLADMSIPSWLLCGALVKPGGRLALVVPATWRSRNYAGVIQYLMLRAFAVETVVEDSRPGWFADALVGTHLVVARRLPDDLVAKTLSDRRDWPLGRWVTVQADAGSNGSLVGHAFPADRPESDFASWCAHRDQPVECPVGISIRSFCPHSDWTSLGRRSVSEPWLRKLEPRNQRGPSKALGDVSHAPGRRAHLASVPDKLRDLIPPVFAGECFVTMEEIGIRTGQGLRTGCNRFFYVQRIGRSSGDRCMIRTSAAFGSRTLDIPLSALRPVLHRQAELGDLHPARLGTHVLDLRSWALPEDMPVVTAAMAVYRRMGQSPPREMPADLADYVRCAARWPLPGPGSGKAVSELSAVRTNARSARVNAPPRFWYMLPNFKPRHLPDAFVPRVIHGQPMTYLNADPKVLIDANFSTLRSARGGWTPGAIAALLNSAWCRAAMEATGTPLGGGALKLEASHLRCLPVPALAADTLMRMGAAVDPQTPSSGRLVDRIALAALLPAETSSASVDAFARSLRVREARLRAARTGSDR